LNVLPISDLHCPWQHRHAFDFLADLKRRYKPKVVVCLGDEIDGYAFSKYPKDPDKELSPAEEVRAATRALETLYSIFPQVIAVESNHTLRPFKRAAEARLPSSFLRTVKEVLGAPRGWEWRATLELSLPNRTLFLHGDGFRGPMAAKQAAERFRCNVVMGHIHSEAAVQYSASRHDVVWGMVSGCLVDPDAFVFDYGKDLAARPVLGTGLILDGLPVFVPMRA
jgi:predicted phosphodiesterase